MLKASTALVILSLSLGLLSGCSAGAHANNAVEAAQIAKADTPRFELVGQAYGLALDTKNGQLCRTFKDWQESARDSKASSGPSESLPLCVDLSQHEKETLATINTLDHDPVTMKAPDGKTYKFPTTEAAAAFAKDSGTR